jgi:hypothetical protein
MARISFRWLLPFFLGCAACGADGNLPVTSAETLSGHKLEFPTALAGKTAVCVFGFSRGAGERTKAWMTRLNQDGVNSWSIANLEKAPSLVRGMIRSSMRKGTPESLQERSLILTTDEVAWERAIGATHENLPAVVILDRVGHVAWMYEGVFSDRAYAELKGRLEGASTK